MNILLILIPVALFLGGLGLAAFIWAMRSGQFDDMEGAAMRILIDDEDNDDTAVSKPEDPPGGPETRSDRDDTKPR